MTKIREAWEKLTGFSLEDAYYQRYIRRDINSYIAVKTDGKVKVKNIFIPQGGILKGYDKPIVAIALRKYFVDGVPVEDTIMNIGTSYIFSNLQIEGEERVTDIYDYCMSKKVGATFKGAKYNEDEDHTDMQRSLRYYASNGGGKLYKIKENEEGEEQTFSLLTDSNVTLFNDYVDGPYDINYLYYIEECRKVICKIEGKIYVHPDVLESKIEKLTEAVRKNQEKYDRFIEKQSKSKAVETTLTVLNKQKLQLGELLKLR